MVQPAKKGQVYFGRFYLGKRCWRNGDWFICTKLVQSSLTPLHQSKSCGEIVLELAFFEAKQELSHRNCVECFLAAGLLAREQPAQDDHQNHGDDADDGAGEFDA